MKKNRIDHKFWILDIGYWIKASRYARIALFSLLLLACLAVPTLAAGAWVGFELDGKTTSTYTPYEISGIKGYSSQYEVTARLMYQDSFSGFDTEVHFLGGLLGTSGALPSPASPRGSPFRYLDLESVYREGEDPILLSELDRLWISRSTDSLTVTLGRQAITWGEAYFFNIGDLFGAFPVIETNRLHKPGIDALLFEIPFGAFSGIDTILVPGGDGTDDSAAAVVVFPLGQGTATVSGGSVSDDSTVGGGFTTDAGGTKYYTSILFTDPADKSFLQAVAGAERQLDGLTHLLVELYFNGWGSSDPGDYPLLLLEDIYLSGRVLTLGRINGALQISRQISPLVFMNAAGFANINDGSAILRLNGNYSVSDLTDISGGIWTGVGDRPRSGVPASEYGGVPATVYLEIVHNFQ